MAVAGLVREASLENRIIGTQYLSKTWPSLPPSTMHKYQRNWKFVLCSFWHPWGGGLEGKVFYGICCVHFCAQSTIIILHGVVSFEEQSIKVCKLLLVISLFFFPPSPKSVHCGTSTGAKNRRRRSQKLLGYSEA